MRSGMLSASMPASAQRGSGGLTGMTLADMRSRMHHNSMAARAASGGSGTGNGSGAAGARTIIVGRESGPSSGLPTILAKSSQKKKKKRKEKAGR